MKNHTYLGIIGICSFVFSAIQFMLIFNFPMIGYLIFKAARGSYSPREYQASIPTGAYLLAFLFLGISIATAVYICKVQRAIKS